MREPAPSRSRAQAAEQGNVTVLALAIVGVLLILAVGGLALASTVTASHRARSAADLAALAGAQEVTPGFPVDGEAVCRVAGDLATANGAQLVSCTVDSAGVVTVAARVVSGAPWRFGASATARAGPAP